MSAALDLVEEVFQSAKDDASVLLAPDLNVFGPIADAQPLFKEYLEYTFSQHAILSPNGSTRHLLHALAKKELLDPEDATHKLTQQKTLEYLQVQCAAALEKMHDSKLAIADKLTSQNGENSIHNRDAASSGCDCRRSLRSQTVPVLMSDECWYGHVHEPRLDLLVYVIHRYYWMPCD